MKPCRRSAAKGVGFTNSSQGNSYGLIKGITKSNGVIHPNSLVILFQKKTNSAIRVVKSNASGMYLFAGLPTSEPCFIVAFDPNKQKNAVIQDNVVPK